jgi:hypothetical protein
VIGRFPGETSCLSLCWAVLDIIIAGARGLGPSHLEYRQVAQLRLARAELDELTAQKTAQDAVAAGALSPASNPSLPRESVLAVQNMRRLRDNRETSSRCAAKPL